MLVMALDHARDFFHLGLPDPTDLSTTTPFLFLTRWVTHFCAAVFVFLRGICIYLSGTRHSGWDLRRFILSRGLWLIFVELSIRTFAVTLNPFFNVVVLQVIWAIGCSVVILSLVVTLGRKWVAVIGLLLFLGHNLLDYARSLPDGAPGALLSLFFTAKGNHLVIGADHYVIDRYAIMPWTGVMRLGHAYGPLYGISFSEFRRRRLLLVSGVAMVGAFLALRWLNGYGDPAKWSVQGNWRLTLISFLNVTKYPCSLLYLSMTLGPALVFLSLQSRQKVGFPPSWLTIARCPSFSMSFTFTS